MRFCGFDKATDRGGRIHGSQPQPFIVDAQRYAERKGFIVIGKKSSLRRLAVASLLLTFSIVFAMHGQIVAGESGADERATISKTIDIYIDGGRKGSSEVMREAFHDGATIYTATAGGPIQLLYDLVDSKPPANDIPYSIANLDVAGNIAMARVEIDDWAGTRYSDMFTLVKAGDDWKIVSKVSYKH